MTMSASARSDVERDLVVGDSVGRRVNDVPLTRTTVFFIVGATGAWAADAKSVLKPSP
jgi:hypothetical protein